MSRFDLGALRSRDELTAVGRELAAEIRSDDVASLAAAVSFKIVLALFPALLAAVAIFAFVTDPAELSALLRSLPGEVTAVVQPQLEAFIERAKSGGIALGGIAVGIWAASGAAATLNKALSRAYDVDDDRKLVKARGTALAVTVALLVALFGISVLLVAGGAIEDSVLASLPVTDTARRGLDAVSTASRYLLAVVLLMILFAFIYWIGPDYDRRPRWQLITPGAALAVVTWLLASAAFGWYVANFGSYTETNSPYGPLGSAIVFMLWLQLSMFALLLGAEVNQVLQVRARRRQASTTRDGVRAETAGHAGAAGAGRASHATSVHRGTEPRPGRAATVLGQAVAPEPATAHRRPDNDRPASAGVQRVPTETIVAAGVAAASSLVGVLGLLRRLKGA